MISNNDLPILKFTPNGATASQIRYGKHYIIMTCHRVSDKKTVARYISDHGLDKAPATQTIKKFGFRAELSDQGAELFRNDKYEISVGKKHWVYNVRGSSLQASVIYAITLEIVEADRPHPVDFTTRTSINAALEVYRNSVAKAEQELRNELFRIYNIASTELKKPVLDESENPIKKDLDESKDKVKSTSLGKKKTKVKFRKS